jgi:hypothetical protein
MLFECKDYLNAKYASRPSAAHVMCSMCDNTEQHGGEMAGDKRNDVQRVYPGIYIRCCKKLDPQYILSTHCRTETMRFVSSILSNLARSRRTLKKGRGSDNEVLAARTFGSVISPSPQLELPSDCWPKPSITITDAANRIMPACSGVYQPEIRTITERIS